MISPEKTFRFVYFEVKLQSIDLHGLVNGVGIVSFLIEGCPLLKSINLHLKYNIGEKWYDNTATNDNHWTPDWVEAHT